MSLYLNGKFDKISLKKFKTEFKFPTGNVLFIQMTKKELLKINVKIRKSICRNYVESRPFPLDFFLSTFLMSFFETSKIIKFNVEFSQKE